MLTLCRRERTSLPIAMGSERRADGRRRRRAGAPGTGRGDERETVRFINERKNEKTSPPLGPSPSPPSPISSAGSVASIGGGGGQGSGGQGGVVRILLVKYCWPLALALCYVDMYFYDGRWVGRWGGRGRRTCNQQTSRCSLLLRPTSGTTCVVYFSLLVFFCTSDHHPYHPC